MDDRKLPSGVGGCPGVALRGGGEQEREMEKERISVLILFQNHWIGLIIRQSEKRLFDYATVNFVKYASIINVRMYRDYI